MSRGVNNIDLQLNARKSNAIRIGSRYKNKCCDLCVGDDIIPWVNEAKYLGLCITSSSRFKCNFDSTKIKYYRAANAILAKIRNKNNNMITLHLIKSIALPCLTYALESVSLNSTELEVLNHSWCRTFEKLFNTFDKNIIKNCQLFSGTLPLSYYYYLKSLSFLCKLQSWPCLLLRVIFSDSGHLDMNKIFHSIGCNSTNLNDSYRDLVFNHFKNSVMM